MYLESVEGEGLILDIVMVRVSVTWNPERKKGQVCHLYNI